MDCCAAIRLLLSLLIPVVLPGSISSMVSVKVPCTALVVSSKATLIEQSMMKMNMRNMIMVSPMMLPHIMRRMFVNDIVGSAQ